MSSLDKVSVTRGRQCLEGMEWIGVQSADTGASLGLTRGLDMGAPWSGEGEGRIRDTQGKHLGTKGGLADAEGDLEGTDGFNSHFQLKEQAAGGSVIWSCESQPGSPAYEKWGTLLNTSHFTDESAAILQHLIDRDAWGLRRYPTPESCPDVTPIREDVEAEPSGEGAHARSCTESCQASAALPPVTGPEGGGDWSGLKRDPRSRSNISVEGQQPSTESQTRSLSEYQSSDDSDIQVVKLSFYTTQQGQAWPSSPEEPRDTPHWEHHVEENFPHRLGPLPISVSKRLTSSKERQAIGELNMRSSKKTQNMCCRKGRSRPSHSGTAASGDLPRAPTRQKVAQEKAPGGASAVGSGRIFPSWGQRRSVPLLEPPSLPAVSGVSLLGKSKKYPCLPSGPRHSKIGGTGKKSVARRKRVSQPVKGEVNEPDRDAVPGVQFSIHRPRPLCRYMHHGQFTSEDYNRRAPQFPGNFQYLSLRCRRVTSRGPEPSGNRKPPVFRPGLKMEKQPPEAPGCPGCVSLRKERDDLKEQLAVMQSLLDKFQAL